MNKYSEIMNLVKKTIEDCNVKTEEMGHLKKIELRSGGKKFSFSDHLRGLIYSLLTNQRPWYSVVPKLQEVDKLFFYYEKEKILQMDSNYFIEGIFNLRCGNRSTKKQMESLKDNIRTLEKIERDYGSLDQFVTSQPAYQIAKMLSVNGIYKLKYVGLALAMEYLRNVGIDAIKPDVHIRRILGQERLGICNSKDVSEIEAINAVYEISEVSGYSVAEIDAYLWMFCASGYCEICTAVPKCENCPIARYCNYAKVNDKHIYVSTGSDPK